MFITSQNITIIIIVVVFVVVVVGGGAAAAAITMNLIIFIPVINNFHSCFEGVDVGTISFIIIIITIGYEIILFHCIVTVFIVVIRIKILFIIGRRYYGHIIIIVIIITPTKVFVSLVCMIMSIIPFEKNHTLATTQGMKQIDNPHSFC